MGKRVGVDTSLQRKKKCAKKRSSDRLSQLPDDVLLDILSVLSLKEAARTSVLSSRWRNLWKQTPSLNFDAQSSLDKMKKRYDLRRSERLKYVRWVNSVLKSHPSSTLKEFRIRFDLDRSARSSITQWLQFAFSRRVKRLELDLGSCSYGSDPDPDPSIYYRFPKEFLTLSSCKSPKLKPPLDIFCPHHPRMLDDFKSLKELSFKYVNFSDGIIELFLHNCPLLERLVVHESDKTSNLEVCGPSLRLKHLELVNCFGLKTLKVSLPNLTSLCVTNLEGLLLLENVPMLVEVYVVSRKESNIYVKRLVSEMSCCFSQLEILSMTITSQWETNELDKFPEMPRLKKLVIEYFSAKHNESLVRLAALIRTSPCLEEFELKYKWPCYLWRDEEVKDPIMFLHHNLKVFKFCGYYGRARDIELIKYISEHCVVLEKIIVYHSDGVPSHASTNARKLLEPHIPHHVELVILQLSS